MLRRVFHNQQIQQLSLVPVHQDLSYKMLVHLLQVYIKEERIGMKLELKVMNYLTLTCLSIMVLMQADQLLKLKCLMGLLSFSINLLVGLVKNLIKDLVKEQQRVHGNHLVVLVIHQLLKTGLLKMLVIKIIMAVILLKVWLKI